MWKSRPDEPADRTPSHANSPAVAAPVSVPKESRAHEPQPKLADNFRAEVAHIGKSVKVKGELSGSEDLYFDGEAEGSVNLHDNTLTIGPNGRIQAALVAREIVVHGKVEGNVCASEKVELKRSCTLIGDISTKRIVIEDGAFFKGAIDIQKEGKPELRKAVIPAFTEEPSLVAAAPQTSFLDDK